MNIDQIIQMVGAAGGSLIVREIVVRWWDGRQKKKEDTAALELSKDRELNEIRRGLQKQVASLYEAKELWAQEKLALLVENMELKQKCAALEEKCSRLEKEDQ